MKHLEVCPICDYHMFFDLTGMATIDMNRLRQRNGELLYLNCPQCQAFERGYPPGGKKDYIIRAGVSVMTSRVVLNVDEMGMRRVYGETRRLITDPTLHAFIRQIGDNPFDLAVYGIMLDWMEDYNLTDKFPVTTSVLQRRREQLHDKRLHDSGQS